MLSKLALMLPVTPASTMMLRLFSAANMLSASRIGKLRTRNEYSRPLSALVSTSTTRPARSFMSSGGSTRVGVACSSTRSVFCCSTLRTICLKLLSGTATEPGCGRGGVAQPASKARLHAKGSKIDLFIQSSNNSTRRGNDNHRLALKNTSKNRWHLSSPHPAAASSPAGCPHSPAAPVWLQCG